jgi:spore coat polysaccharide biosynthesis predicted glycosyltransferase SpsG
MNVTIYTNGGASIGYGHLMRTNAIAKEYLNRGCEVGYLTQTPDVVRRVVPNKATVEPVSGSKEVVSHMKTSNADILLTDSHGVCHKMQQRLRSNVPQFGVVMDENLHSICCDVFINGNIYAPKLDYDWTEPEPEWCLGIKYVPLRDQIREYTHRQSEFHETPEQAIITMGGSDQENVTPTAVEAIKNSDISVDVIIGPGFSSNQQLEVRSSCKNASADINIVRDPDDLAERMFQSDFAVCTASTTTYELLALQTPIISVPVVDNQEPIANALRSQELAIIIDHMYCVESYRQAIERYMNTHSLRKYNQMRGNELIDGKGVERIVDSLSPHKDA